MIYVHDNLALAEVGPTNKLVFLSVPLFGGSMFRISETILNMIFLLVHGLPLVPQTLF